MLNCQYHALVLPSSGTWTCTSSPPSCGLSALRYAPADPPDGPTRHNNGTSRPCPPGVGDLRSRSRPCRALGRPADRGCLRSCWPRGPSESTRWPQEEASTGLRECQPDSSAVVTRCTLLQVRRRFEHGRDSRDGLKMMSPQADISVRNISLTHLHKLGVLVMRVRRDRLTRELVVDPCKGSASTINLRVSHPAHTPWPAAQSHR